MSTTAVAPHRPLVRPGTPARPVAPARTASAAATPARPAPATPAGRDVVVPGENLRTGLCFTAMVLSPLIQASQTLGMLANASFKSPLLAKGAAFVVGSANALARLPLVNNPVTRGALRAAGVALPFVNAAILMFDGYAAYQTFSNPDASAARKWLTGARLGFNALATGLCFVPGNGAVLAMAPAWISIGLDLWIKRLNATEPATRP